MCPVPCTNTHHDIKDLANHMVKNTKFKGYLCHKIILCHKAALDV